MQIGTIRNTYLISQTVYWLASVYRKKNQFEKKNSEKEKKNEMNRIIVRRKNPETLGAKI